MIVGKAGGQAWTVDRQAGMAWQGRADRQGDDQARVRQARTGR